MKYKSIFVSDVHLGTKDCKANLLLNFLTHNQCDELYLVGDIIDGWKVKKNKLKWKESHTRVIRKILGFAKSGTKVTYVAGNHDEFLRLLIPYNTNFGNIEVVNQCTHLGIDGKRYLVTHGDFFDGVVRLHKWISFLGDSAYDAILSFNTKFNWFRRKLGFGYWSLSKFLKVKVKRAVDFIFKFENTLSEYCKKRKFDGVICGHIHLAEIKTINGVVYMNDGDWVESCTALVEHYDGRWEIVTWLKEIENVDTGDNSSTHKQSIGHTRESLD
jgi:UDP-2,3-diacylglucosamine pyrophosphatase LpxH